MTREREDDAHEGFFRRAVDFVFGYDFFISYSHGDGKSYPKRLKTRLEQAGFKVFLDQTEYVAGIDLRRETRRHVRRSQQVVVVGRSHALASQWVMREVDVALGAQKTPVVININKAVESAPDEAPVASAARQKHWLRLDEMTDDVDGEPADNTINELVRGFRYTRQQTKRVRIFAAASVLLAIVASLAVWQAAEAVVARNAAYQNELMAREQRDRALTARSRFLAGGADQALRAGDSVTALLIALEGFPEQADQHFEFTDSRRAAYAAATARRELRVFAGHESHVLAIAVSPDGKRIATGSEDQTARLWDAETGRLIALLNLDGDNEGIGEDAFSPDGRRLFSLAHDGGNIRLRDGLTGELVAVLPQSSRPLAAFFSPNGARVFAGYEAFTGSSTSVGGRLWDAQSGRLVAELKTGAAIYRAWFNRDGQRLLTALADGRTGLWDGSAGTLLFALRGAPAAISPDGHLVITGEGNQAMLWDATTGAEIARLPSRKQLSASCFSLDGDRFANGSEDGSASLWEVSGARKLADLPGHERSILSCQFSPDGDRLLTISTDLTIRLWDGRDGSLIAKLDHPVLSRVGWRKFPQAMFDRPGSTILTVNNDETARLWNAKTGAQIVVLAGHRGLVTAATFSPDGAFVFTASRDSTARLWKVAPAWPSVLVGGRLDLAGDGRILVTSFDRRIAAWRDFTGLKLALLRGADEKIMAGSAVAGRERAVTVASDGAVSLWDAATGRKLAKLEGHLYPATDALFSRDGSRLVTYSVPHGLIPGGGWPGADPARLWDAETGRLVAVLNGHEQALVAAAFDAGGTRLVTTSGETMARVWDAKTGQPISVLTDHQGILDEASFNPSGDRLITYGRDWTARIWSTSGGPVLAALKHGDQVTSASFSPDGKIVLTSSLDGATALWDSDSGRRRALLRQGASTTVASFSRDGSKLIAASADGRVHVWDTTNGSELGVPIDHQPRIDAMDLTADARLAVTGSEDGMLRLWNLATGEQIGQMAQGRPISINLFTPDGKYVATQSADGALRLWPVSSDPPDLAASMRRSVPRCLTPRQRLESYLAAEPPDWCIELEKWPYGDPAWRQWLANGHAGSPPAVDED
jgi:WD40 repeat protein